MSGGVSRRCLVTGGAGFLGAHLTRALLDRGHEVVVLDDLSGGFAENVDERARFVRGSVVDHVLVDELLAGERFDHVYHLAAYAAEGLSQFIKRFNHTNNLLGSVNLINAAVNGDVDCFVFTSSIAVYGSGQVPMSEDLRPEPEDSYGIAKLAVERELAASHEQFGLEYVIFRPHNVYGALQNIGDRYRNVIGIFMNQIMRGEPLSIFGDGEQTRAFSYVGDVIPAIAAAPVTEGARQQAFNIGADVAYSVNQLADAVRSAMGVPDHPVVHRPARGEVRHAVSDHAKLAAVFGEAPSTPLEEGLERMAAWARDHGPRRTTEFAGIEISKNLPPSWREAGVGERVAGGTPATAGKHLVFGPDGNRRWAVKRGLPYSAAYELLPERLRAISEWCFDDHALGSLTIWLLQEYNLLRDHETAAALAETAAACVERMATSSRLSRIAGGIELVGELDTLDAVAPGIVGDMEAMVRATRTSSTEPRLRLILAYNADKELARALGRCETDGVRPTFRELARRWCIPPVDVLVRTGQPRGVANLSSYWPGLERGRIVTSELLPQEFDREALTATLRTYATAVDSVKKLARAQEMIGATR